MKFINAWAMLACTFFVEGGIEPNNVPFFYFNFCFFVPDYRILQNKNNPIYEYILYTRISVFNITKTILNDENQTKIYY